MIHIISLEGRHGVYYKFTFHAATIYGNFVEAPTGNAPVYTVLQTVA
jgi:hypothetical protein